MNAGPGEIVLVHLQRLKSELRKDLESIEEQIAEFESECVVKRNRIEELASILHTLASLGDLFSFEIEGQSEGADTYSQIQVAQDYLKEMIGEAEGENSGAGNREKLVNVYTNFRSRLINTINILDLVAVALRKHNENVQRESAVSQQNRISSTNSVIRNQLGSSAIIRSQELERQRIAREIHDGPAQAMANVVLRMDILLKVFEKDPSRVPDELARMKEIAQGSLDEIRGFIFDLRPMTLQDLGLVATIKRVVASLKDLLGLNVRLVVEGEERKLGQLVTLAVFRIAQEATTNLRKYSKCKTAWIHLKYLEDKIILIIEDDGLGFDINEVARSQKIYASFGLLGMQERADDINAKLEITSNPGEGTKIVLIVPTDGNPAMEAKWDEN